MIRTLIVDDEAEIRKGLQLKVDWKKLGFHITEEAIDGLDAIHKLHTADIQVVVTDMVMPNLNGVGLLTYIHEHYPHIIVIVLTGYDDFSFTKAAIKHRAFEYLLKPVMPDELEQTLKRIKIEIIQQRETIQKEAQASSWHAKWLEELRENFCIHLLKGDLSSIILSKASSIHMESWNSMEVRIIALGLQTSNVIVEQFQLPFELLIRELVQSYNKHIIVCKDTRYDHLLQLIVDANVSLDHFLAYLEREIKGHISQQLVFGKSKAVTSFQHWHFAAMDAILQWSLTNSTIYKRSAAEAHIEKINDDMIARFLQKQDQQSLIRYVQHHLFQAFTQSQTQFIKSMFEILIVLERSMQHNSTIKHELWLNPEKVLRLSTVDKALIYIEQYVKQYAAVQQVTESDDLFSEVQKDIDQNYVYELTLPMLAKKYNYNTSYFSELFKLKVGKSFVNYLTDLRMQHACKLLQTTDLGLSDIAELTGFSNASYFSARFKKMFNVSPSEYRTRQHSS